MVRNGRLDNKQLIRVVKKQIRLCLRYRHFRSIFFVSMKFKGNYVYEYLEYFCKSNWFVRRNITTMRCNTNEILICFKNGSYIRVVPGTISAKGYKANNVVIDSNIENEEVIHCIIRPMIIPIFLIPPKWVIKLFKIEHYRRKRLRKVEYIVDI